MSYGTQPLRSVSNGRSTKEIVGESYHRQTAGLKSSPLGAHQFQLSNATGMQTRHFSTSALHSEERTLGLMSKSELTNEVLVLKESNRRLLQDVLLKDREGRELQDRLILSSKTNAELMDELSDLTLENQRLKLKAISVQEENNSAQNQLSHLRKMYRYSFPKGPVSVWESRKRFASHHSGVAMTSSVTDDCDLSINESWEEVSEKLFLQMQQECDELESLNQKFATLESQDDEGHMEGSSLSQPSSNDPLREHPGGSLVEGIFQPPLVPSSIAFSDECESECVKSLIHHLRSQVEHLKIQANTQGTLLKSALGQLQKFAKAADAAKKTMGSSKKLTHPSDELFRAYFTKQLHKGAQNNGGVQEGPISSQQIKTNDSSSREQEALEKEEDDQIMEGITEMVGEVERWQHSPANKENKVEVNDSTLKAENALLPTIGAKVCPICDHRFARETTQSDFENHVFEHLEKESTVLLEQYEMV